MASELVDIHPPLLKFIFELGKQISCTIQVTNKTEQYVAFKVKTTSPKKYCVRPNVGVVKPRATYEFSVTMQAQTTAPPDLQCKDKFLVQSTVVPFGITEETVTSEMFAKDPNKLIEEKKMKVILVSPAEPPFFQPLNILPKQQAPSDLPSQKDKSPWGAENLPPTQKDVETLHATMVKEEPRSSNDAELGLVDERNEIPMAKIVETGEVLKLEEDYIPNVAPDTAPDLKSTDAAPDIKSRDVVLDSISRDVAPDSKLSDEVEELKHKLKDVGSKLTEAEKTISRLREETTRAMREKQFLQHDLVVARKKCVTKKMYVGYPFLYVCMIALIGMTCGYLMRQ